MAMDATDNTFRRIELTSPKVPARLEPNPLCRVRHSERSFWELSKPASFRLLTARRPQPGRRSFFGSLLYSAVATRCPSQIGQRAAWFDDYLPQRHLLSLAEKLSLGCVPRCRGGGESHTSTLPPSPTSGTVTAADLQLADRTSSSLSTVCRRTAPSELDAEE
jgi:hypothetical protein